MAADGGATARPGAGVEDAHRRIRERIDRLDRDREPGPDLAAAFALVHDGDLIDLTSEAGSGAEPQR
jgi:histidine ammonia-lyase